jgi:hypothetical protein
MTNTAIKIADLQSEIEAATGKTISQLMKLAKAKKDRDGNHDQIKIKSGMSLVWIANANYGQGERNGYGAGLYAKLQMCGAGTQSIRLAR